MISPKCLFSNQKEYITLQVSLLNGQKQMTELFRQYDLKNLKGLYGTIKIGDPESYMSREIRVR